MPRTPASTARSGHSHDHGGDHEIRAHDAGPGGATLAPALAARPTRPRRQWLSGQGDAIRLGTLYALGHGAVVIALGLAAIAFGALLPDWLDPIMGRIVGFTLVALGVWVMYSVYRYARGRRAVPAAQPLDARVRRRCAMAGATSRRGIHGHEHVEPLEMSSYGAKTSFGVGMIHGIGAETGTQVLLIAAVGGASSAGLGVPMLFAFVIGLLLSNFAIVLLSSVSFVVEPGPRAGLRRDRCRGRACSACSSGRSSCSASTASCRTSGRSCPSDPDVAEAV